ncbi:hypothetical protein PsYK624_118290 [Phanerochaete sordida]|uniref:Uncharacterized protein n=1 Tax=Phanerochaete sordida TaxID=48140 RepID=A0A9P3GGM9_9APHY|nr:hypothetical protein PsYK624_118290 [Phanerochaete sordida]
MLPAEILHGVIELYVATHIDETVESQAQGFQDEEDDDNLQAARSIVSRPIVSCLLATYQFRQITLEILSKYLGIPLAATNDRLESSPWPRLAAVRAFALTNSTTGIAAAEFTLMMRASPALSVYVFAAAALHQLHLVPRPYDVAALTIDHAALSAAEAQWKDALRVASTACDRVASAPLRMQLVLRRHAHGVLAKATLAQKYGRLLPMLVRRLSALYLFQAHDAKRDYEYLPTFWPHLSRTLRNVENETLGERKPRRGEEAVMPEAHTITDLCVMLQQVVDIDVAQSEGYSACHARACALKADFEQISRMSSVS